MCKKILKAVAVFVVVVCIPICTFGLEHLENSFKFHPYGVSAISEGLVALSIVLCMYLNDIADVFTKNISFKSFREGLFLGCFDIMFGIFTIVTALMNHRGIPNIYAIVNTLFFTFFIGVFEETLFRGLILNALLKKYGDTRKGVWLSIIISAISFGCLHIPNLVSQSVSNTILQVIHASCSGIVYGVFFYRTKNIWANIVIHGFWDFGIFFQNLYPVMAKTEILYGPSTPELLVSIVMAVSELIIIYPFLKDINAKVSKGTILKYSIGALLIFLSCMYLTGANSILFVDNNRLQPVTYKYESATIENYSLSLNDSDEYQMDGNGCSFTLKKDENKELVFVNNNTGYSISFDANKLIDFEILEERDYYVLTYEVYDKMTNYYLYFKYIDKDCLTNDEQFMNDIKDGMNKYLLVDKSNLCVLCAVDSDMSFVCAHSQDYGYYILTNEVLTRLENLAIAS